MSDYKKSTEDKNTKRNIWHICQISDIYNLGITQLTALAVVFSTTQQLNLAEYFSQRWILIIVRKRELREGNVFTGVCLSIGWGLAFQHVSQAMWPATRGRRVCIQEGLPPGVCLQEGMPLGGLHPGGLPPGSWVDLWPAGTSKEGSMHPTGMLSCSYF